MSQITYEASVYSCTVKYTNFKQKTNETILYFSLDPLQLMEAIAGFAPKTARKSGNPAIRNAEPQISDQDQVKFVRDLASRAAGFPSEDGETWEAFENFADTIAGKAFLTKLASSDAERRSFAEKVFIKPFADYVGFAQADPSNSPAEIQQFKTMLSQLENLFVAAKPGDETIEQRRARLQAEMAALNDVGPAEGTQGNNGHL